MTRAEATRLNADPIFEDTMITIKFTGMKESCRVPSEVTINGK